jgi:hypothetical protein
MIRACARSLPAAPFSSHDAKNPAGSSGVTFLEVMVVVLILGIGLIPVLQVFSRGNRGTMMTRDEILAHTFAGELIDYAHALGYENLPETTPEGQLVAAITINDRTLAMDPRFKRVLTVRRNAPTETDADWPYAYKTVKAEILWESGSVRQSFVLTSLVFHGKGVTP